MLVGERRPQLGHELLTPPQEDLAEQVVLVVEERVHRPDRELGQLGHLLQGGVVVALAPEDLLGGVEQLLAAEQLVAAPPLLPAPAGRLRHVGHTGSSPLNVRSFRPTLPPMSSPPDPRVRLDIDGPIATITNDNVEKHNAFDDAMDQRLFEILGELKARPGRAGGDLARRGQVVVVGPRRRLDRHRPRDDVPPRADDPRATSASSSCSTSRRR